METMNQSMRKSRKNLTGNLSLAFSANKNNKIQDKTMFKQLAAPSIFIWKQVPLISAGLKPCSDSTWDRCTCAQWGPCARVTAASSAPPSPLNTCIEFSELGIQDTAVFMNKTFPNLRGYMLVERPICGCLVQTNSALLYNGALL